MRIALSIRIEINFKLNWRGTMDKGNLARHGHSVKSINSVDERPRDAQSAGFSFDGT